MSAAAAALLIAGAGFLVHESRPEIATTGLAALHVPRGFRVEQVTARGSLSYPMMGTLDDRGRLFLCESSGNTQTNEEMSAHPDYIVRMLEDRDGDGVYDHSTVFAEHLTLPAGAVWYRNSLYVAAPPDLLRFDSEGRRETVVTGWNMSSNAASLHGPFFGPDGWLYLTDGRHGFDIKTKDGRAFKGLASRIWRVRPDGTGLESFAGGGFDNPVELVFTPAGETIGTMTYFKDPENGQRDALLHFVEGGVYPKWYSVVSEFKRTGGLMPVMTKFARIAPSGLALYRSGIFGPEYRGNLFSAQFNPHRVQRHIVYREGATFRTEDQDFLTSSDPDFHPTDVMEDADGSLLVVDTGAWFIRGCPISRVAKPEIKGAVYRIRKIGAPVVADPRGGKLNMAGLEPDALTKLLEDARPAVRDRAVELLVERGGASASALARFRGGSADPEARAAAVFALFRIGTPEAGRAVRAALNDGDFQVRTAAARCVGMAQDHAAVERLMEMTKQDNPAARRQAAAALGQIGDARGAAALLEAAGDVPDRFVEHSIIYSLITLRQAAPLLNALGQTKASVRKAALIALDQMDGSPLRPEQAIPLTGSEDKGLREAALFVVSHHPDWAGAALRQLESRIRDRAVGDGEAETVRDALLAFMEDADARKLIGGLLRDGSLGEQQTLFVLDTIDASSVKQLPADWVSGLGGLLGSRNANVELRAIELIRSRGVEGLGEPLSKIADDKSATDQCRVAAMAALAPRISGEQSHFLMSKLDARTDAVLRQSAAQALARSTLGDPDLLLLARDYLPRADPLTLSTTLDCFRGSHDEEVGAALIAVLRKSPAALGTLGEDRLKTLLAGYPESGLLQTLRDAQAGRGERLRALRPLLAGGETERGRRIFFGEKVACFSCHTIGQEGGHVGPDLTGIGAIRSGDDLLEAIVFPSASFVPGHEVYNVDTETERIAGVIRSQSKEAIVLVTGPNGEARIPRSRIRKIERSNVSLMPEGFDTTLSKSEFADLLAFLQAEKTRPRGD